ncbi:MULTISPECIES: ATP-binding protein [Sphingobacterium]|uniref:ATP-binding protein n=1 Tax=Sphingobacterium athyrii TaxID=2152717 RepID=A0A363NYN8_9SPHI|nr:MULTISPECIES: ATP-binding protein [Sphingobacterium]PUV25850.1 ATP-binding protein [Sphingobacterium athyrii]QIH33274.1 ATP-binding protein [Sphingobacterium sp. DR205]
MKKNTQITNLSIESAGLPKDPKLVIAEYIWNGFDAKATEVDIVIDSNELGYINSIGISDNGEGIVFDTLPYSFGNFLDSVKKNSIRRSSYTRGKKGKGRFSFSLFATRAIWNTIVKEEGVLKTYRIQIDRDSKEQYDVSESTRIENQKTGTQVRLEGVFGLNSSYLESKEFIDFMAQEFGWFLYLNRDLDYTIRINGAILIYDHLIQETDLLSWTLYSPEEGPSYTFHVNYIRWNQQIGDRYYYYLRNSDKREIAKVLSSFNNNAIDFHHSVYVTSDFFDAFEQEDISISTDVNLFTGKEKQVVYRNLLAELRDFLDRKQKKYVRENAVAVKLSELEKKGFLPGYGQTDNDKKRKETLLALLQEIYIIDPRIFFGVKTDLIRTYLGFLDLLLQTEKSTDILTILEKAIPLSDKERSRIKQILIPHNTLKKGAI